MMKTTSPPSVRSARPRHELAAAIRADRFHGGRARWAKTAFVCANVCYAVGRKRGTTSLTGRTHFEGHVRLSSGHWRTIPRPKEPRASGANSAGDNLVIPFKMVRATQHISGGAGAC